jgi:hypothetical protein
MLGRDEKGPYPGKIKPRLISIKASFPFRALFSYSPAILLYIEDTRLSGLHLVQQYNQVFLFCCMRLCNLHTDDVLLYIC